MFCPRRGRATVVGSVCGPESAVEAWAGRGAGLGENSGARGSPAGGPVETEEEGQWRGGILVCPGWLAGKAQRRLDRACLAGGPGSHDRDGEPSWGKTAAWRPLSSGTLQGEAERMGQHWRGDCFARAQEEWAVLQRVGLSFQRCTRGPERS